MKRLLVTGSRNWTDRLIVRDALAAAWRHLQPGPIMLVEGEADGLDSIAADIWGSAGLPIERHPADWDHCDTNCKHAPRTRADGTPYCPAAGPRRNLKMIRSGADLALAFPLGKSIGTQHCMRHARAAGIPVWEWGLGGRIG
ncbi:SLOG family protein [Nocardia sp. NPDC051833]|uniref:SLOG family protein n=1 Tax=Nocardia sp. NPDC051833 TaxID=3155674 RepID=UPI00341E5A41